MITPILCDLGYWKQSQEKLNTELPDNGIHFLVNNAAISGENDTLETITEENFDRLVKVKSQIKKFVNVTDL